MTQSQNVDYDTYERVIKCCKDNPDTVALMPVFANDLVHLESHIPDIRRLSGLISTDNTHTDNKAALKNDMIALALSVCTNLGGYGIMTKDNALEKIGKNSKSSLGVGKEEEILARCTAIADKARSLLTELTAKRGMPETLLTKLETAITDFRAIKPLPRSTQQDKSSYVEQLENVFDNADTAMTLLMGSAVNFKELDAKHQPAATEFLARLTRAATPIAARTARTKTKFEVSDGTTKQKITTFDVASVALNLNRSLTGNNAVATSPHKGSDFAVSSAGYETAFVHNQRIKRGQVNIIKVELLPIQAM